MAEPVFRIEHGTPTAEEIAALVGVLLHRKEAEPPIASRWAASARPGWRARSWRER